MVETEAGEGEGEVEDDLPLIDEDATNAWDRYKALIIPGIFRWKRVMDEERRIAGDKRPRKPLLFLLCADRAEADEIANFLQYGEAFAKKSNEELVGRPLVGFQHPQLGEAPLFVSTGPDGQPRSEVIQVHIGEQEMNTEEGWKRTRDLVNAVDQDQIEVRGPDGAVHTVDNPITVIVSVMMLKEGWDVRNVKVIVPLRSCASRTLTEQTLGRGLRRMNRPDMADNGAVDGDVKDELYVLRHPSFERVIREINDLVEQRTSAQINEGGEPQFAPVPVQPEAALREAHAVSWVRVEGVREVEVRWRDSFRVEQLPRGAKLPWRDQFDSRLIETTLEQDGVQRPGERIEVGAKLAYHTYNRLLDQLYVEPLSKALHAGRSHLTALRSVVKDTLEKRTFALPAGLPLSLDGAVASEDGWIAIANLVRPEIREHVMGLLREPLREAMAGPRTAREPVLREERSDQRAGYTARAEHLVKGLKRSSFTAAAVDNADEQRVVALLERCPDVVAWVHNHRSGLGWFLPYEVNGEPHRYYPDFVARVALKPSEPSVIHNVILEMKGRMDALDAAKAAAGAQHAQTLSEAMQEPWQYLLLREDDRAGITDLSWWEGQSAPTFAGLLRHVEPIGDAAGLGFRLLTNRAIDGAVLRGVDEAGWLSGDALRALGGRSPGDGPALPSADPDRLLLRAEALVAAGQLRRALRAPAEGADDEAPGKLAELLARLERGEALSPEELALQVGYRHGEGRA